MTSPPAGSATGVIATLKVLAILAVIAMALLGILLVFDVVPLDDFGPLAGKMAMLTAIVAVAASVIGVLSKATPR